MHSLTFAKLMKKCRSMKLNLHNTRKMSSFVAKIIVLYMGRTKFSQHEIDIIAMLLRRKEAGTRFQQKQIRHQLRVNFEFSIADFNEPGKSFGEPELRDAIKRGAIQILDDATIASMKEKRARDKERDEAVKEAEAIENGATDWKAAMKEWEDYYKEDEK